jgi:hypothetical protein
MKFSNGISLNTIQIEFLSGLIGSELIYLISNYISVHPDLNNFGIYKADIVFKHINSDKSILYLYSIPYLFNEILGDEIDSFDFKFKPITEYEVRFLCFQNSNIYFNNFFVKRILIFGQQRNRTWSQERINKFFNEAINFEVIDELKTIEYFIFEDLNDRQIVFKVERGTFELSITSEYEKKIPDRYYEIDDIDMRVTEEFYKDPDWLQKMGKDWPIMSVEKYYKLLYKFE